MCVSWEVRSWSTERISSICPAKRVSRLNKVAVSGLDAPPACSQISSSRLHHHCRGTRAALTAQPNNMQQFVVNECSLCQNQCLFKYPSFESFKPQNYFLRPCDSEWVLWFWKVHTLAVPIITADCDTFYFNKTFTTKKKWNSKISNCCYFKMILAMTIIHCWE